MRFFVFIVLMFFFSRVNAQRYSFEYWHDGSAVLETGDTIKSKIKYDLSKDLIQISVNRKIQTYSARKILFFEIFDLAEKRYRQFYSMPFTTSTEYKSPIFFELLVEGKITVLCREAMEYRTIPNTFGTYGNTQRLVIVYHYFLLEENGEVVDVKDTKSIWMDLMGNKAEQVNRYVKENKLDYEKKYDLAKAIGYYNSLFKK
jgi:hypothetical protein